MRSNYKEFALEIARRAGDVIKSNFTLGMKKQWKEDNTPVTETDIVINEFVVSSIKEKFPDHSVLSEEGSAMTKDSEFVWVCDPVDGTIPFSHGIPTSVFSLALVRDGNPILGVIYDPFMDRLFTAEKGNGAYLNGAKIAVSRAKTFQNSVMNLGWWPNAQFNLAPLYRTLKQKGAKLIDLGSTIYMGALLASGEFVANISAGREAHDSATIKILVEEGGGRVTDLFGNEQRYDQKTRGHLATNGLLHDELLRLIQSIVKEQ